MDGSRSNAARRNPNANNANGILDPLPRASLPPLPLPPPPEMTRPERRWEVYGPCTERCAFPAMAAPQSTNQQQAIAAAPPAASLAVRLPTAAAPPLMPTRASAKNLLLRPAPAPALSSSSTTAPAGVSNFKMDRMLVAADAFNKEDEEGDHITQVSIGSSVKSSSTGSGGSKPNEMRPLSPEEVTSMEISLKEVERKRLCMNIEQMQQMATECGVDETDPDLWLGLLEIIHSERAIKFFMDSNPVVRLAMIKHYAKIYSQRLDIKKTLLKRDEESADEELEEEYLNSFIDNNPGTSSRKVLAGRRPSKPSSSQGKQELSSKPSKSPKRTKTT